MLDVFQDIGIDRLIINGDLLDFYNVNLHDKEKHPEIQASLEDEFESGNIFFEELFKKFPNTEIVYIFGNHEDRLDRWIVQKAKAFWNIVTIEKQLNLANKDMVIIPYMKNIKHAICTLCVQPYMKD